MLSAFRIQNGKFILLVLLVLTALVFGFYQLHKTQQSTRVSIQSDKPAYKTGKAFEVIEPVQPATLSNNKTPGDLIGQAEQIVAKANAIIEQHNLGELETTADEKQAVAERVANFERQIIELDEKLGQQ